MGQIVRLEVERLQSRVVPEDVGKFLGSLQTKTVALQLKLPECLVCQEH